jgi:predicted anti-sigma-YlaC factor YlaD
MSCDEYRPLISGYIDEELEAGERQRLEEHLKGCASCRRELEQLRGLTEELRTMEFEEPTDAELERYWRSVYNRLERAVGWILLSLGAILLLGYGGFKLVEEFVRDPQVTLALKVGVLALMFGAIVLFVSLLRERMAVLRSDRYSREVKR